MAIFGAGHGAIYTPITTLQHATQIVMAAPRAMSHV